MNTQQFFEAVSGAVQGNWYEVVILILLIAFSLGYLFWRLKVINWIEQRRRTRELYRFLRSRHSLSDEEWDALENTARALRIKPKYLAFLSEPLFAEMRDSLLHELNDEERVDTLHYKLFLK